VRARLVTLPETETVVVESEAMAVLPRLPWMVSVEAEKTRRSP